MHTIHNNRGVSTLVLVLLMLASAVIGGFISYFWVLSQFYLEPEGIVDLAITDLSFPVDHANYFNMTIMNPSHSASSTNITAIDLTSETVNGTVGTTYPALPIPIDKGNVQTIKCVADWGDAAGKKVTVHVLGINASAERSITPTFVKLDVRASFDAAESIQYFNVSVTNNQQSAINLTMSKVLLDSQEVTNTSMTFPRSIAINETTNFQCFTNWKTHGKPVVEVQTLEGYTGKISQVTPSVVSLQITNVIFNESNSTEINVTISNGPASGTLVQITSIEVAYGNKKDFITAGLSDPSLPYSLRIDTTQTFRCGWNWTDQSMRGINVTLTAHTKQGFDSDPNTLKTPFYIIANITGVSVDVDDTAGLTVNVTNAVASLFDINVTSILFNQNSTSINSSIVNIGAPATIICGFDWSTFVGTDATITVNATYNATQILMISQTLKMPYFKIRSVTFSNFTTGTPQVNVTVYSSAFSTKNATITGVSIRTQNETIPVRGDLARPMFSPLGYNITAGSEVTLVCIENWDAYVGQVVTIIAQSADGVQASIAVQVIPTPP